MVTADGWGSSGHIIPPCLLKRQRRAPLRHGKGLCRSPSADLRAQHRRLPGGKAPRCAPPYVPESDWSWLRHLKSPSRRAVPKRDRKSIRLTSAQLIDAGLRALDHVDAAWAERYPTCTGKERQALAIRYGTAAGGACGLHAASAHQSRRPHDRNDHHKRIRPAGASGPGERVKNGNPFAPISLTGSASASISSSRSTVP